MKNEQAGRSLGAWDCGSGAPQTKGFLRKEGAFNESHLDFGELSMSGIS